MPSPENTTSPIHFLPILTAARFTTQCCHSLLASGACMVFLGIKEIADRHGVATAQIPVAWAIAKGALPIIGVTKVYQVEDAAKAAAITLTAEEVETLDQLAAKMPLDVIRYWEKEMK